MGNRRMTRLTNAFSKKAEDNAHMMAILLHALQFREAASDFEDQPRNGRRRHVEALGNV
jgi:hypothetical protein